MWWTYLGIFDFGKSQQSHLPETAMLSAQLGKLSQWQVATALLWFVPSKFLNDRLLVVDDEFGDYTSQYKGESHNCVVPFSTYQCINFFVWK